MTKKFFPILFALVAAGCSHKKIDITPDYIINENWSKKNDQGGGNSIKITRMRVIKDSIINLFSDLGNPDVLNKLEEDSLFRWFANVRIEGSSYKDKKIYFNLDNGFSWLDDVEGKRTRIFGSLDKDNWYKFSHLVSYPFDIYIYVDSSNKVHRFDVNMANY
jgi:hypothetical protein